MFKNGQTYFKNHAVFTPQHFQSIFDHLSTYMKGLRRKNLGNSDKHN